MRGPKKRTHLLILAGGQKKGMSFAHFHHHSLPSTYQLISSDPILTEYIQLLAKHDVVLLSCDHQTAGVGTYGADGKRREWKGEAGNFCGSFLLRVPVTAVRSLDPDAPDDGETCLEGILSVLGAAVALELRKMTGVEVKVKYPNDLIVNGLKAGGMFCDAPRTQKGFAAFDKNSALTFEPSLMGLPEDAHTVIGLHLGVNRKPPSDLQSLATGLTLKEGQTLDDLTRTLCEVWVRVAKEGWGTFLSDLTKQVAALDIVVGLGQEIEVHRELDDPKPTRAFFEDFSLLRGALRLKSDEGQQWARPRTIQLLSNQ